MHPDPPGSSNATTTGQGRRAAKNITNITHAIEHLKTVGLLKEGEEIQIEDIAEWIITASTEDNLAKLKNITKALGIALKESIPTYYIQTITKGVSALLNSNLEKANVALDAAHDTIMELKKNITENNHMHTQYISSTNLSSSENATYADITRKNAPNQTRRRDPRSKQIILDKDTDNEDFTLYDLSEEEIVKKANDSITIIDDNEPGAIPKKIKNVTKLRNGGIILEADTEETARWIRANKAEFISNLDHPATLKGQTYSLLAEFVPTSHIAGEEEELRCIEEDSEIEAHQIVNSRWIKAPERRNPGQRAAHLIIQTSTIEAANQILKDGLIIRGKKVKARKLTREPRRCLKCQKLGANHLAAQCTKTNETCGTCAQDHKTTDCVESEPTKFRCVNCEEDGHASWDRTCPKYIKLSKDLEAATEHNTYRFFPTDEEWTWEKSANKLNIALKNPLPRYTRNMQNNGQEKETIRTRTPNQTRSNLTQTTLEQYRNTQNEIPHSQNRNNRLNYE